MAPKRKPVKKPKQKQKQKQVVKQSVRVNVQSSGGSGAGGTSGPLPMQFRDTSGENQRLMSLVEQIARSRAPIQQAVADPVMVPIPVRVPEPVAERYNPANDEALVDNVFNAPINTKKPVELGPVNERPIARKKPKKVPASSEEMAMKEAGYQTISSEEEYKPIGYSFLQEAKTPYGKTVPRYATDPFAESSSVVQAPAAKEEPSSLLQRVGVSGKTYTFAA